MSIFFAVILGFIQALTEFLPVSSSGHLALFQTLLSPVFGDFVVPISFDIFMHLATLATTIVFLRSDIFNIISNLTTKSSHGIAARQMVVLGILGTVPAGLVGVMFKDRLEAAFSTMSCIGYGFLVTSAVLGIAHFCQLKGYKFKSATTQNELVKSKTTSHFLEWTAPSWKQAILIGIAQAIAIMPGISRSGSTIAAGLILGLPAESALRFSFLLSIPTILGAGMLEAKALYTLSSSDYAPYAIGFGTATIVSWYSLRLLVALTKGLRLSYFAIYTGILGLVVVIAA